MEVMASMDSGEMAYFVTKGMLEVDTFDNGLKFTVDGVTVVLDGREARSLFTVLGFSIGLTEENDE